MATTIPGSMAGSNVTLTRTIIAADANYNHATLANAIDCAGLKRIIVVAEATTGSGTITIQPCLHVVTARDADTGGVDAELLAKDAPLSLGNEGMAILDVYGRKWTLHVPAISAGSQWKLYVGAYEPFWADAPRIG
jgi:hypothetical protein